MLPYLVLAGTCIPWGRPFACRLSVDGLDAGIGREDIQKRGMPVAGMFRQHYINKLRVINEMLLLRLMVLLPRIILIVLNVV